MGAINAKLYPHLAHRINRPINRPINPIFWTLVLTNDIWTLKIHWWFLLISLFIPTATYHKSDDSVLIFVICVVYDNFESLFSDYAVAFIWQLLSQVVEVSTSKTGKHGHAKCHFVAIDIFNSKKLEDIVPSSHNCDVNHLYTSLVFQKYVINMLRVRWFNILH